MTSADTCTARTLLTLTQTTRRLLALADQIDAARTDDDWARVERWAAEAQLEAQYAGWLARKLSDTSGEPAPVPGAEGRSSTAPTRDHEGPYVTARAGSPVACDTPPDYDRYEPDEDRDRHLDVHFHQ